MRGIRQPFPDTHWTILGAGCPKSATFKLGTPRGVCGVVQHYSKWGKNLRNPSITAKKTQIHVGRGGSMQPFNALGGLPLHPITSLASGGRRCCPHPRAVPEVQAQDLAARQHLLQQDLHQPRAGDTQPCQVQPPQRPGGRTEIGGLTPGGTSPPSPEPHHPLCPTLHAHRRWWRVARPRSVTPGHQATDSSCKVSLKTWSRPSAQSSRWGHLLRSRCCSRVSGTGRGGKGGQRGPQGVGGGSLGGLGAHPGCPSHRR